MKQLETFRAHTLVGNIEIPQKCGSVDVTERIFIEKKNTIRDDICVIANTHTHSNTHTQAPTVCN